MSQQSKFYCETSSTSPTEAQRTTTSPWGCCGPRTPCLQQVLEVGWLEAAAHGSLMQCRASSAGPPCGAHSSMCISSWTWAGEQQVLSCCAFCAGQCRFLTALHRHLQLGLMAVLAGSHCRRWSLEGGGRTSFSSTQWHVGHPCCVCSILEGLRVSNGSQNKAGSLC